LLTIPQEKNKTMETNKPIKINLTGNKSQNIKVSPGQGSFSIGPADKNGKKFDAFADINDVIDWHVFDTYYTPAGSHWPRFFYYAGNDSGFIKWSVERPIDDFHWFPTQPMEIDFTNADIRRLFIDIGTGGMKINTGAKTRLLGISGHLSNLVFGKSDNIPALSFSPEMGKITERPYNLPAFPTLSATTALTISCNPLGQAFDCNCLLQFPHLEQLSLHGNFYNFQILEKLKKLRYIALRYVPDLSKFPALSVWENLQSFIGWNIEEQNGKLLKAALKALSKEKKLEYSSVSKLRKVVWFTSEYGLPFSGWEEKNAKKAIRVYRLVQKEITKAKTTDDVKIAIEQFIAGINNLPGMETTEREDAATAALQLAAYSSLQIPDETTLQWFNQYSDF